MLADVRSQDLSPIRSRPKSIVAAPLHIASAPADGSGKDFKPLVRQPGNRITGAWSPENRVLFVERRSGNDWDVWSVPANGSADPEVIASTPSSEILPRLSRDDRWLAFVSNVTGRNEIWVQASPALLSQRGNR